jgi:hypothetical protein
MPTGLVRKTDNGHLAIKLDLRRHFLRRYHAAGGAQVLDCCQGGGALWGHLRREFDVASYWGVDVKAKKGRLKIDSVRILQQPGWPQDVIDVDTYGSPWKHWAALLANLARPVTVFLTIGQVATGTVGSLDMKCYQAAGMVFPTLKVPAAFGVKLASVLTHYVLTAVPPTVRIVEAVEAEAQGNARYIGVRLEPVRQ